MLEILMLYLNSIESHAAAASKVEKPKMNSNAQKSKLSLGTFKEKGPKQNLL